MSANDYLTVNEAAAMLRVSVSTIRRWIRDGSLRAYRIGQRRVVLQRNDVARSIKPARANPDAFDGATIKAITGRPPDRPVRRKLTPQEIEERLEALERAKEARARTRARTGVDVFPSSQQIIDEMREERTRQLTGEDDPRTSDQFDPGPIEDIVGHPPRRIVRRRLSPDDVERRLRAMDRARELSAEMQARRGGELFSPSWQIINESRDERTRQLTGEDDLTDGTAS